MLGLKPIKTLPIREKIAANLREAILSKKIPAGEVLTLESTAQELGYPSHRRERHSRFWQETAYWNWNETRKQ